MTQMITHYEVSIWLDIEIIIVLGFFICRIKVIEMVGLNF